ncbi:MAG: EutN/CcmL family microcompartment protein [Elusimicrobia bacterium]|nr:EutN/CcmL family microcompartment protein [Elusimicrobiota bacterium]
MFLARVVGSVWATKKHESLSCQKLLLVETWDPVGHCAQGEPLLAMDCKMGSGPGDIVLVLDEGNSARQVLENPRAPVRTLVCGVVDRVYLGKAWRPA